MSKSYRIYPHCDERGAEHTAAGRQYRDWTSDSKAEAVEVAERVAAETGARCMISEYDRDSDEHTADWYALPTGEVVEAD